MRSAIFMTIFLLIFTSGIKADDKANVQKIVTRLQNRYGIKINFKKAIEYEDIKSKAPKGKLDWEDLARYTRMLEGEMKKYTPGFFRSVGLKRIYIVKKLTYEGEPLSILALPKFDLLVLDYKSGMYSRKYQRHIFHHQLYLFANSKFGDYSYISEKKWLKANPRNFEYGQDSTMVVNDPGIRKFTYPRKGLVNKYATKGIIEDQAEIFAIIMMIKYYKEFATYMQFDQRLRKKVGLMKKYILKLNKGMREHYFKTNFII